MKRNGFTLLEVVISLAIMGILIGSLAAAISLTVAQAPKNGAILSVEDRQQLARYWLTRDANSAEAFTPGSGTTYGTLTWHDYSVASTNTYQATYYYDSALQALMRSDSLNGVTQSTVQVASDIQQESDVTFVWSQGQSKITVTLKPTVQEAPSIGDISRTATLVAYLRYKAENVSVPPALTPVPTPVPGSVTYYVAADPTVLLGTYVSGNAASLTSSDNNFYVVNSTTGSPKEVTYEVHSQTMTSPTTISNLQVIWVGQVTANSVAMTFYVKASAGASYPAGADAGFTFTQTGTNNSFSFYLTAAEVSAVNSSKVVYLKVDAQRSASYTVSTDQILFIASP